MASSADSSVDAVVFDVSAAWLHCQNKISADKS